MSSSAGFVLARAGNQATRFLWYGLGISLLAIILLTTTGRGGPRDAVVAFSVVGGPIFLVQGLTWKRLLVKAEQALTQAPLDFRVEVSVRRSAFVLRRYLISFLWPVEGGDRPVAGFSDTYQFAIPRWFSADKVPAQVLGDPSRRAAVVVRCAEGILVGRLNWSRFKRSDENGEGNSEADH